MNIYKAFLLFAVTTPYSFLLYGMQQAEEKSAQESQRSRTLDQDCYSPDSSEHENSSKSSIALDAKPSQNNYLALRPHPIHQHILIRDTVAGGSMIWKFKPWTP